MKLKSFLTVLLLLFVGLQTTWAQAFRVYQSDGTLFQFSLKTDSIVFDNGLSGDEVFGPFTPVNFCIAKTWYKSKTETMTFNADGTTDYMAGATYEFMPYQGNIIIYNASNVPMSILKVYKLTSEVMIVGKPGSDDISVWSIDKPVYLVKDIQLSETSIFLSLNETHRLTATVLPTDADNPAVAWTSSNADVATVINGLVVAIATGTCTITCSATDGSGIKAECKVTVFEEDNSGTIDGRDYVDLGLPSGTLWATCNVGANSPEEYGDYFAWGETNPKSDYSWSTYKYCKGSASTMITKYCTNSSYGAVDNKTELEPSDDAATVNWGSEWQMPSREQCAELINSSYTTTTWTTFNGVYGRKITSNSNGNSIFLPAAGYRYDTSLYNAGGSGSYWSRSLYESYSNYAYYLDFVSSDVSTISGRCYGRSVRPVRVKK
ncbi:MAG: Ig-like domain-containing protein [Bacteroidaceae bacterium]|nr:Ig-like domain-containing protein [Bacteroidaceae bacterium]